MGKWARCLLSLELKLIEKLKCDFILGIFFILCFNLSIEMWIAVL